MANNPPPRTHIRRPKPATDNKPPKAKWKRDTASFSRWLHIYLSMVSFFIILFFAVTGLTLNHADWFDGHERITKYTGKVPLKWVHVKDTAAIAKLEIVQYLKHTHHVKGDIGDFIIDDNQCTLSFKGPGYAADGFVNRETGDYKLTETTNGIFAVMNDLHKGRDTGKKWSWVIDVSAVFLSLLSLSGLVMICFMKKKRFAGFVLVAVGGFVSFLIYYFLVP